MGLVVERFLMCDGCSKSYGVDERFRSTKFHRYNSKNDGWKNNGSKDYCPDCKDNF